MLSLSAHFIQRQEQRGLRRDVLNFIIEFGELRFSRKATWIVVERRTLPTNLRSSSLALRAAQWLVLVKDGVLITCYRSDNPLRYLRRSY
jgi:hypothetical protein